MLEGHCPEWHVMLGTLRDFMGWLCVQTVIRLRRRRPDANVCWQAVRRGLAWPLLQAGQLAHVVLSKTMLLSCEVALEYMLGLTYSPQVLNSIPPSAILLHLPRWIPALTYTTAE